MKNGNWSRVELIVAFNLYCRIPFGKIHTRNPEIISLAATLGRTPSALSWKLANFASLDPCLKARKITGATHGSKLEEEIWDEFNGDWERLSFESEEMRLVMENRPVAEENEQSFPEGKTRDSVVRTRVNQGFFRAAVLAAYNYVCCITGLTVCDLLIASHIMPWSIDVKNRTNPRNGLCLNAIHDRAFDLGLITITSEYEVAVSPQIRAISDPAIHGLILKYEHAKIFVPERFAPEQSFLEYHQKNIFGKSH